MAITKKDVDYVARLARLSLSDGETEKMTGQLGAILETIEKLKELDTANVPPTSHPFFTKTAFREDRAEERGDPEKILANAPSREDSFFKVPKVIE
jgi:aspartyl-tRNA(Asn)/glutamyl-tRNA(Gln) amidotransferase subunit C